MKPSTPEIGKLPARTVLTITAVGSPQKVFARVLPLLYSTAYGTKFKVFKPKGKKMEIGHLACAYPDGPNKPMAKWTIMADLEVSSFVKVTTLIQKDPKQPVKLAKRPAATIAQILHVGPYSKEGPNIKKLHAFIKEQGFKIVGDHEEVYLTRPGPKAKTIIRYAVKKKDSRIVGHLTV